MEKFSEFLNESKGTYAGGSFSKQLDDDLTKFSKDNNIPNINTEYHTTILYSRKFLPKYEQAGKVSYKATPNSFHIFEGDANVLVVKLDSKDLVDRHNFLMKEHSATYDFPVYIPHITLSYDIGDFDISKLNIDDIKKFDFSIIKEYKEDLNLDWKNK